MGNMHEVCILCKSRDIFTKYIIYGFTIFHCKSCSLFFIGDKISREELKIYYEKETAAAAATSDDYIYNDPKNIENLNYSYVKLAELISRRIPTGKILDVGCSGGYFLDCMQGWECYGIERVSLYAEKAKAKYGNNIHQGTLEDYECASGYFDVITLQNVLDHMPDPLQALNRCNSLLKPNGLIVVKVHDFSCLFARLMGLNFYAFYPLQHLVYFNKENLTKALLLCGFEVGEYTYLVELLFLKTIPYRFARGTQGTFSYRIFKWLNHSTLGNIKIRKNLHDIITVFARKK